MKLHYRGATYESAETTVQPTECDITGHYRGKETKICQPIQTTVHPEMRLKYRGAWVR